MHAGLPFDSRLVVTGRFDREGGAAGIDALLAGEAPFTAVCCANDLQALGALVRLAQLGIAVPADVSIGGFDDIPVAAMTAPESSVARISASVPRWTKALKLTPLGSA